MNLHEFQGKSILESFGIQVQRGFIADTSEKAIEAAKKILKKTKTKNWVIKAQIHAGGRGKGGGIKLAKSLDEVKQKASQIIGMNLITPQTSLNGKKVHQVFVAEDVYYSGEYKIMEFYISIMLNRLTKKNIIIYSPQGGVDIEIVAKNNPEYIFTEEIDSRFGLQKFQARKIAFNFKLNGEAFSQMTKFIISLYNAYIKSDASLFEINPLLKSSDNKIIAVDAKVIIDDNALFRHPDYLIMRDFREEDPIELEASKYGLNFVNLDGNIGCIVNGAGLAMATMDIIKLSGGSPANFLDIGGTADPNRVEKACEIIIKNKNIEAILINIFGGIVRCDRVIKGLLNFHKRLKNINKIPIIIRLEGTNSDIAKKMLYESKIKFYLANTLTELSEKIRIIFHKK